MKPLFFPAEDSSTSYPITTDGQKNLLAWIAQRAGWILKETATKIFLAQRSQDKRPPTKPAPDDPSIRSRMGEKDQHAVISGGRLALFSRDGEKLWQCDARTTGSNGGPDVQGGDTPPGLYTAGLVTWTKSWEDASVWKAFGFVFVDFVEMQDQERSRGRAGVGGHGGGTGLADPLANRQGWMVTHGCVRMQNEDSVEFAQRTEALQKAGATMWITVR